MAIILITVSVSCFIVKEFNKQSKEINTMKSIIRFAEAPGIPPVITTVAGSELDSPLDKSSAFDSLQLSINPTYFVDKSNEFSPTEKDESTADETCLESSTGFSSCNHTHNDSSNDSADDAESADDATDSSDDEFSTQSHHTNDSTRFLLQQAQKRMEQQSIYEEVKLLRANVSQYKDSEESAMRQKLDMKNQCNILDGQLAQAMETIQSYKRKELQWNEEKAERELDFMNQLNDVCRTMETKEQDLMEEIVKRDVKIIELRNSMNEEEMRRMRMANEKKKKRDVVAYVETQAREEMLEVDSWSDESSCEFI